MFTDPVVSLSALAIGIDVDRNVVFYPNAYHGFDRELPPRSIIGTGKWRHLEYDATATKDAAQKTRAWLDRYLK